MAAICVGNFTAGTGQYLIKASLSGAPNLRASSTICVRLKNTTASTTIDSVMANFCNNALSSSGGVFGRNNGVASTGVNTYRGGGVDIAVRSTCYGNTTTWYHLTLVYNAATQFIRFYIDGVFIGQQSSVTTSASSSTTNSVFFGQHPCKIADAAIWNRALTDLEVASQAAYRVCQVTSGLLGFWRLDSNGNDTSGNSQTFTAGGTGTAVSYSTGDNPPQPETPDVALVGDADSASTFAGTMLTAKAIVGSSTSASTLAGTALTAKAIVGQATSASTLAGTLASASPMVGALTSASTIAAWMRPRWGRRVPTTGSSVITGSGLALSTTTPWTICSWARIFNSAVSGTGRFQITAALASARLGFVGNTPIYNLRYVDSAGTLIVNYTGAADTAWHHLAMTFDGTTVRAFVDAVQVASGTPTNSGNFSSLFYTADNSQVSEFAHTKLWQTELSAAQLASEATYTTPHVANAQLYAWWQLSWQNVTLDSSGNGRTLTDVSSIEAETESPGLELTLLAGNVTSASTIAGTLKQAQPLAGDSSSASTFAGTALTNKAIAGTATSASTLAGAATTTVLVAGQATSASTLAGTALQTHALVGQVTSASSLAAAASSLLTGSVTSASTLAGVAVTDAPLVGAMESASTLEGALGVPGVFQGSVTSASTLSGSLETVKQLTGDMTSASALAGTAQALVAGDSASASTLNGDIGTVLLSGNSESASRFLGELRAEMSAAALSASTLVAVMRAEVVGASTSASTFAGTLTQSVALVGVASSASTLNGVMTGGVPVGGGGGRSTADRRMLGALGTRRRIR